MKLVLVESPTKARTLSRFLPKDFRIEATYGHLRDLPPKRLGVAVDQEFTPEYEIVAGRKKRIRELRQLAAKSTEIILATDPDREGEAIAWHAAVLLGINSSAAHPCQRIVFHEITKPAIKLALQQPRRIDFSLVDAQQARRILDRLVGYKLSPLLWKKVRRGLSAGRVQSLALRFIVERERERERFLAEEFWQIGAVFSPEKAQEKENKIAAKLAGHKGEKYEIKQKQQLFDGDYTVSKTTIANDKQAAKIVQDLRSPFIVQSVEKKEIRRIPPPPLITSSLQRAAAGQLGFSVKRTMAIAQRLYEKGLITYHRTDSYQLAEKFVAAARKLIAKEYGAEYLAEKPRRYKTRAKTAQEAHEAIRPTNPARQKPIEANGEKPTKAECKLYALIWRRALATQAAAAIFAVTKLRITAANDYRFAAAGSIIKFDGYLKISGAAEANSILPPVKAGTTLKLIMAEPAQKFTSPPPRYSQASLIRSLEKNEVGRPSTYAPIISTILARNYVELVEKRFIPTPLGISVNDFLVANFPDIVNIPFTAQMESKLDKIAQGEEKWKKVLQNFYKPFAQKLGTVEERAHRVKIPVDKLGEKCPKCSKGELVIRVGRFGKFVSCDRFPQCKYTRSYVERAGLLCPECGGDIVVKRTRAGKRFYGCANYPECEFAAWKKSQITATPVATPVPRPNLIRSQRV